MRIAFVTNAVRPVCKDAKAGIESFLYSLIEELVELGHEITLYGHPESITSGGLIAPALHFFRTIDTDHKLLMYNMIQIEYLRKKDHNYDLIHFHTTLGSPYSGENDLLGLLNPSFDFVPSVLTIHHNCFDTVEKDYFLYQDLEDFQYSGHTLFVSKNQFKRFQLRFPDYYTNSKMIYLGLRESFFKDPIEKCSSANKPFFLFLGAFTYNKGAHLAIEAYLNFPERCDYDLKIAGYGIDCTYYEQEINPYLDQEGISFLGALDYKDKRSCIAQAEATLLPIQGEEAFGLVAIESLALGTPVIAWERSAFPEIIDHGVSGFLVSSLGEMIDAMREVKQLNPDRIKKECYERFHMSRTVQEHLDYYNELIASF